MGSEMCIRDSFKGIWAMLQDKGIAMQVCPDYKCPAQGTCVLTGTHLAPQDVLTELHEHCLRLQSKNLPKALLIASLADAEARLAVGTNEKLQLGGLVGVFQVSKASLG